MRFQDLRSCLASALADSLETSLSSFRVLDGQFHSLDSSPTSPAGPAVHSDPGGGSTVAQPLCQRPAMALGRPALCPVYLYSDLGGDRGGPGGLGW